MSKPAYIWATWLRGLIAGDQHCVWAVWFKAQGRYDKRPETDESKNRLAQWRADHALLVRQRAMALAAEGWTVTVEDQNRFSVRGQVATVAGVADLVGVKAETAYIEDCKTGDRKDADAWQVVLYLNLLPLADDRLKAKALSGGVAYRDGGPLRMVSAEDAYRAKDAVFAWVKVIGGPAPPRTPSASECRFCDIAACPDRVSDAVPDVSTGLF